MAGRTRAGTETPPTAPRRRRTVPRGGRPRHRDPGAAAESRRGRARRRSRRPPPSRSRSAARPLPGPEPHQHPRAEGQRRRRHDRIGPRVRRGGRQQARSPARRARPPRADDQPGRHSRLDRHGVGRGLLHAVGLCRRAPALHPLHVRRGVAQARADLVRRDLDLLSVLALLGLPGALLRRPVTTTRMPLVRLSATFSARSRQQMTSKNDVDSCHSWVVRSCQRRLTATPSWAVAWPSRV